MNVFFLANEIEESVRYLCDRHVVKMSLETAQLLCSPFEPGTAPYKRTHYNHPCSVWARASLCNYLWLCNYGLSVCKEYNRRYDKDHKSEDVIAWCATHFEAIDFPSEIITSAPKVVDADLRHLHIVEAYREQYRRKYAEWLGKGRPMRWRRTDRPRWIFKVV